MALRAAAAETVVHLPHRREMRPIDLVHLAKQCLGDEGLEHEVLRLFDTTIATYFDRLVTAGSDAERQAALHAMKGAAGGVGAWTIADLAKAAETEMQAGREVGPERVADLGIAIEEVRSFIARMLSEDPA